MKFKCIFAEKIYAVILPNRKENEYGEEVDELERVLDLWHDVEYLKQFYENNKDVIGNYPYYSHIKDVHDFIEQIFDESEEIEELIEKHFDNKTIEQLFEYLHEKVTRENKDLRKAKQELLRIYAIKLQLEDEYIITGGAIKITKTMQEHPDTNHQLELLHQVQNFIKENDIYDIDSLIGYTND